MIRLPTLRSVWKVTFCVAAALEIQYVFWARRQARTGERDAPPEAEDSCRSGAVDDAAHEFTLDYTVLDRAWESTRALSAHDGPVFCVLCLIESLIRAIEARQAALDNRTLGELEDALLQAAQKSSARLSMIFTGAVADRDHKKATKKVSHILR